MTERSRTADERLSLVERDLQSHSKTITELTNGLRSVTDDFVIIDKRVAALEQLEISRQKDEAVLAEREKATVEWRKNVDLRFTNISGAVNKLAWIVVGSVVLAFITWALSGGMKMLP